jgi:hypothetical protein
MKEPDGLVNDEHLTADLFVCAVRDRPQTLSRRAARCSRGRDKGCVKF